MAQEIKMPDLGSDIEEGVLLNWIKKVGETINEGDVIAEIETDKATVEVPAPVSGTILELIGDPGDTLKVGAVIGHVGAAGEAVAANGGSAPTPAPQTPPPAAPAPAAAAPQPAPAASPEADTGDYPDGVKASPVARKVAADKGIDLRQSDRDRSRRADRQGGRRELHARCALRRLSPPLARRSRCRLTASCPAAPTSRSSTCPRCGRASPRA